MSEQSSSDGLEAAVRDPSLQDTTAALAEVALDAVMQDGVLRDIPLVGSLLGLGRAALTIRDRVFLNKLRHLLTEIVDVPVEQRQEMIDEINQSEDFTIKVGEKLLYIVDRCEDHQASGLVGILFRAFLEGSLDYSDFLRLTLIVDRMHFDDLMVFARSEWEHCPAEEASAYLGTGLVELDPMYIRVEDQWDWKASEKYIVEGGELTATVTVLGRELRGVLAPKKQPAEQGVAPQSATRPESDSEGGDKPQPESEPRPR